jgi:hypothetical protein
MVMRRASAVRKLTFAQGNAVLILKIGTALLMSFAATLILLHAKVHFVQSQIIFLISIVWNNASVETGRLSAPSAAEPIVHWQ